MNRQRESSGGGTSSSPRSIARFDAFSFVKPVRALHVFALLIVIASGVGLGACSNTDIEATARPSIGAYNRVAIWTNLSRSLEEYFLPVYMRTFPNQTLVERRDLTEVLSEQDLLPDRLDPAKRAELRRVYGVEAIVYPNLSGERASRQLSLKVIDTVTGEIVAAVLVTPGSSTFNREPATTREMLAASIRALEKEKDRAVSQAIRDGYTPARRSAPRESAVPMETADASDG